MALPSDSQLVATFKEAMAQWDRQKAEGIPLPQRVTFMANILRLAWPKGREGEWKYLCTRCDDYGLEIHECPGVDGRCESKWGTRAHPPHSYGTPCWCSAGAKFRPKVKAAEDFAEAGRVTKPSRIGR
jgi:hypothetical protein